MLSGEFFSKLNSLNEDLWVDTAHKVDTCHPDFKMAGLYCKSDHLMAVSYGNINQYSIFAVRCPSLYGKTNEFIDIDWIAKAGNNTMEIKLLSRGYLTILQTLIKKKLIDKKQAEKLFDCDINPASAKKCVRYLDYWPEES